MKDNRVQPGDRVSWVETYDAAGYVVTERLVWGEVNRCYYHPGSRDGHAIAGVYVSVQTSDGRPKCVLGSLIRSVQKR